MRHSSLIICFLVANLILILVINMGFSPLNETVISHNGKFQWAAVSNVIDSNSTFYEWDVGPHVKFRSWKEMPLYPPGWFELALVIPFEIYKNWSRIVILATFSTGTYGGVIYYWTLSWQLYNETYVALSKNWNHSLWVSTDTPVFKATDIPLEISREHENSSIYLPGKWFYQLELVVHNATLKAPAEKYTNYYGLSIRITQETEVKQSIPSKAAYTSAIAAIAITTTIVVYITKRKSHEL